MIKRLFNRLWNYLNPMKHLGERKYPLKFPFITTLACYILIDLYSYFILKHPDQIGNVIVFLNFALVLYFSFRSALSGGLIVTALSVFYYIYYLLSRTASVVTKEDAAVIAGLLTLTNLIISLLVGWHRKTLDRLLDKEIQAKRTAEEEKKYWHTLLQQLPVGVIIAKAPSGEIITRNNKATELLGRAPFPKSVKEYTNFNAYIDHKKIQAKDWPLARAITEGKTITGEELVVIPNRRKRKILFFNAAPVKSRKGKIIAAVTTFYDITAQKELERQKDDFIAMASHELRTPLTSAKLYAQSIARDSGRNPKIRPVVLKLDDQIEKLAKLVSTMLDTTRIEQGKLLLEEEPFVLKDIALKVIEDLRDGTQRQIKVDWQTQDAFRGNKEKVSQIFTNLITNAIKFSPSSSQIIVTAKKINNYIVIGVQDFGVGLSLEEQKHIFDKYYQSSKHKTYPGLGLGLYISSEIVKQYGGKMWVKSQKGKGTTFYFNLPVYKN